MENKEINNTTWEYFGEEAEEVEDTLSFCNLTMQEYKESSVLQTPRDSSCSAHEDFFEFFNEEKNPEFFSAPDIIFCGKIMEEELNEYQKRDYLAMVKSHSFRSSYDECPSFNNERDLKKSSTSTRYVTDSKYHVQRVNITSLTSMSAKSRRRMFMFGPVKFKPEMELSAIKERQGRRSPKIMFPASEEDAGNGKAVVVSKAGGGGAKKSHWSMVRSSLKGRSHLTAVLAKSFGCIPRVSVGKWIKVAN
ncbi:hypothetical protein ACH5RR_016289 [Cinchona calisaya]|uniref:Uncharacterized protein n=1 Tax=Cinchona calisaya TaxID=153742 RepID=A0ABD2ZYX8_9GENT